MLPHSNHLYHQGMPRPPAPEPWVVRTTRLPASLDADLRRIAVAESTSVTELERDWLYALVALHDAKESVAEGI